MLRKPLFAAALLSSVAAIGLAPALAQSASAPASAAAPSSAVHPCHPSIAQRMLPGQLVDGRIAFLKAELKITPAQEAQWQKVAAAMHQNAAALDRTIDKAREDRGQADAVRQMEIREQFARVRADNATRLVAAFKPLYASLSPGQQRMANALLAMAPDWHRGGHKRV
jgi:periplasmic protein CpxP/Spy